MTTWIHVSCPFIYTYCIVQPTRTSCPKNIILSTSPHTFSISPESVCYIYITVRYIISVARKTTYKWRSRLIHSLVGRKRHPWEFSWLRGGMMDLLSGMQMLVLGPSIPGMKQDMDATHCKYVSHEPTPFGN